MIEDVPNQPFTDRTYRYANQGKHLELLREMGLDREDIEEMLALLRTAGVGDTLDNVLDAPFALKPNLVPLPTRFSDGTIRVFYSGIERATAEDEVSHSYLKEALAGATHPRAVYYQCVSCTFDGTVKDMRPKAAAMSFLIADNGYADCQTVARIAVADGADGLLAPSARRPKGTCLPVFRRGSLSMPEDEGFSAFIFDPATNSVQVGAV